MIKHMKKMDRKILKTRGARKGTIATTITVITLVLIISLNILVGAFADKFPSRIDLTGNKVFNITSDSIEFVKSLDKEVEINVLNNEKDFIANGDYYVQANEVIKQYASHSNKIKLKYTNLADNPTLAGQYPEDNIETNSIIVKCKDKYRILTATDIFDVQYTYYGNVPTASNAEQAMTSALMYVTSDEQVKISLITGYEQSDASGFISLLKNNNFEVTEQNILTENIDTSASAAIIFGVTRDFDDDAIKKLDSYLNNNGNYGKNIIYVATPDQGDLPKLNAFLKGWGIKIGDGLVFETNSNKLLSTTSPFYNIHEYVDEEFASLVKNQSIPVSIPYSKPIEVLDKDKVRVLLQSSETTGVIPSNIDETWSLSEEDITGPIPSAVLSSKTSNDKTSNVIVFGSILGFDTQFLSKTGLNNSSYFINMFNKVTNRENAITIESKTIGGQSLGINANQATIIGLGVFTIALPLIIIILGIIIWIRRRNK